MTTDKIVAVIGAGAAGIAATATLASQGIEVTLFEASAHIGGRAKTVKIGDVPVDLGGGYLHSADRNPLARIAEQKGLAIDRSSPRWRSQYLDLGFPGADREEAMAAFEALVERLDQNPPSSDRASDALDPDCRWNGYIQALSGYINGTEFEHVSATDYVNYDNAATDENWRLPGGYGAFVASLLPAAVRVHTETAVRRVNHGGRHLLLETDRGTFEADLTIVAVPTSMLAQGRPSFEPAIEDHAVAALMLPLGHAEKLFLTLAEPEAIPNDEHLIGNPYSGRTGSYQLRPQGRPVIEGFFGGRTGLDLAGEGADAMASFAIDELVALLGSDLRRHVTLGVASGWAREPWIAGAYSHALPGHAAARAVLASPIDDRIFFAGEATSVNQFSTVHGAYQSGVEAAETLLKSLLQT